MIEIIRKLFVLFLCFNLIISPLVGFAGGDGSSVDPYLVSSCDELQNISELANLDKHYLQSSDIDCGISPYNVSPGFMPIGNNTNRFNGSYDGNNSKISDLFISRSLIDYVGLFGYVETGSLINIRLIDVYVTANDNVGGLVGDSRSEIINSSVIGNISGNDNVGGLAGRSNSNINNSYSISNVTGNNNVVGLVGHSDGISNSYATGNVTGNNNVGGLVGSISADFINNTYSTGRVTGNNETGGLIGRTDGGNIINSFTTSNVTGITNVDNLIGRNTSEITFDNLYYLNTSNNPSSSIFGTAINFIIDYFYNQSNNPMTNWPTLPWYWHEDKLPDFIPNDYDGDGTPDSDDHLIGNLSNVVNNSDLNVSTNENDWVSVGIVNLNFTKKSTGSKLLDVTRNLTINRLYMKNVKIERIDTDTQNTFLIKGFDLVGDDFKTIYFDLGDNTKFTDKLCIKDEEINLISSINSDCKGSNEFLFKDILTSMPNSSAGMSESYVNISWDYFPDKILKITGLNHSAITQYSLLSVPVVINTENYVRGGRYWAPISSNIIVGEDEIVDKNFSNRDDSILETINFKEDNISDYDNNLGNLEFNIKTENSDLVNDTIFTETDLQDVTCSRFWICYWWIIVLIIICSLSLVYYYNNKKNQINVEYK
ncbi:MAG: hypothetical protein HRU03_02855 [Nanoarchaeales archaeon]|nr:hypothetical protein [Nanoarchaeales archaeon]